MIALNNIHVIFNKGTQIENHALKGLNLQIQGGEFITVIGGNGAGKSTLMSVITGELIPTSGTLSIQGEDCTYKGTVQRSGQVARIFQDPMVGTFSHLSILENLAIAKKRGQVRSLNKAINKTDYSYFKDKLKMLDMGLEKRLEDRVSLLSGGQRQALSLVMATLLEAQILILDEHTAALDPKTARLILDLTREIVEESKMTTLMVTHSMHQALDFGTRTLLMKQGEVLQDLDNEKRKLLTQTDLLSFFD